MPRDYKHRATSTGYSNSRRRPRKSPKKLWRWLLVAGLIIAFMVFLNMIRNMAPQLIAAKTETENLQTDETAKQEIVIRKQKPAEPAKKVEPEKKEEQKPAEPEEPRYDFYTILPQAEIVVPDYEIKTRVREELVGKTKAAKYIMQAGSFREASEADHQKAKLALLGIESHVEKAKVGNVIWHRIKIGPYDNPSSVSTIKELLQKNGFGVIVTESNQ